MNKVNQGWIQLLANPRFIVERCWKTAFTVLLISCLPLLSAGQSTTENPGCPAGFGIDGDVYADIFSRGDMFCDSDGTDDWLDNMTGGGMTGIAFIDQSDPQIQATITDNIVVCVGPETGETSTHGGDLLDALYIRDNVYSQSLTDGTFFQQIGSKNIFNPNTDWDAGPGGGPQKNDLVDMFAALKRDTDGILWFFGASSTRAEQGSHHIDYEFFQEPIGVNETNDGWVSEGQDFGRTAWKFTINGPGDVDIDTIGDLLFSFDFEGGGTSLQPVEQEFLLWMSEADYLEVLAAGTFTLGGGVPIAFTEDFETDDNVTGEVYGYARIEFDSTVVNDNVFTVLNATDQPAPSWGTWADNSVVDVYESIHFSEVAVNVSAFGLDFLLGQGSCTSSIFATLVVKTRSSFSFTADLKDFAKPAPFGSADEFTVECGETPTITCDNTSVEISATIIGDSEREVELAWYDPADGFIGTTESGATLEVDECGTYTAYARYVEDPDCVFDTAYCEVLCDTISPDLTCTPTPVSCFGDTDGSVTVTINNDDGGSYSYDWSEDACDGSPTCSGLAPGTYTVTVTDDENGCSSMCSGEVTEPDPLGVQGYEASGFSCCPGPPMGQLCLNIRGGTAPYSVTMNGETQSGVAENATICFDGLSGNTNYSIEIVDANNCPLDTTFFEQVNDPQEPTVEVSQCCEEYNICCSGEETGYIHLGDAVGCSGPIVYSWTGPDGFSSSEQEINFLAAGVYYILVTDDCDTLFNTSIELTEPDPIVITLTSEGNYECEYDISCAGANDGSIDVDVSGGCGEYDMTWTLDGEPFDGDLSELGPGEYCVTVVDEAGCESTECITLEEPDPLSCEIEADEYFCGYNVSCNGAEDGSIEVTGDGGCEPYTFTLGATSNGTGVFSGLGAGAYSVTITDANGCESECNVILTEPDPLSCEIEVQGDGCSTQSCDGGVMSMLIVDVDGGCPPYSYALDGGAAQPSNTFNGVGAGAHYVTVTDANGCETTCEAFVEEPEPLTCSIDADTYNCGYNVSCYGAEDGAIEVTGMNGCPPYTFTLGAESNNTGIFSGLGAGMYTVTIEDGRGCTSECDIELTEPDPLSCETDAFQYECGYNVSCNGAEDGEIEVFGSGGCPPYEFTLGATTNGTGVFSGLGAGYYVVTITDANGCESECDITLTEPDPISCEIDADEYNCGYNISCYGGSDGAIEVTGDGGCPPYTFTLGATSNGTGVFTGLSAGLHTVTISDANGCESECEIELTEPDPLSCEIEADEYGCGYNVSCYGAEDGEITVTGSGGCPPYEFTLGATTNGTGVFSGLGAGYYVVTITDANGCESECDIELTEPDPLNCEIDAFQYECGYNVSCYGAEDGEIEVFGSGGCPPYEFTLGATTNGTGVFSGLGAGYYVVTITDANGCESECDITLTEPDPISCEIDAFQYECGYNVSCYGAEDGEIEVFGSGGCPPYEFTLGAETNGTGVFSGLGAGYYEVTITDANGCESTCDIELDEPDPLSCVIYAPETNPTCGSDGNALSASASGGCDDPYTYSWTVDSDDDSWEITAGANTSAITYSAGTPGVGALFTLTVTDANGCETTCELEVECESGDIFCTFTQGYYGNPGGLHCDGSGTYELIDSFLQRDGYILLGDSAAGNSIIFFEDDAQCIIDRLPGGGPPRALDGNGSCADPGAAGVATHGNSGRFRNVLLAQTLTLALNLRLDPGLASLTFADSFAIIMSTSDCGGVEDGTPIPGTEHYVAVPTSWIGFTVADVFEAANAALAGTMPQPELRDLAVNVGWINETFDECVFLAGWLSDLPPVAKCKDITVSADDNCEGTGSIDDGSYDPDGDEDLTLSYDPPGPYSIGTTEVTLTIVTERDGQSDMCSATITVVDDTPPVIECQDVTINLNADGTFDANPLNNGAIVHVSDNCGLAGTGGITLNRIVDCSDLGIRTQTYFNSDLSGNESTCSFQETILDPLGVCPDGDRSAAPQIEAHPNPSFDRVEFVFNVPEAGRARVELIDDQGSVVKVPFDGNADANTDYTIELDLSALQPGIYYYRLISGDSKRVRKLIVLN